MKKLLLCALLCAAPTISHAADAPAPIVAPAPASLQIAWNEALAINDVAAARKLVAAPDFSPTLQLEHWGESLIYMALEYNRGDIAALIIERAPAEFFLTGKSQLRHLGKRENVPALRALLARGGFDPNTRMGNDNVTPLLEAADERNVAGVAALLADTRTDPNARNANGETALFRANSGAGAREIVAMLLADKRTDPNAINNDGDSALHVFATDSTASSEMELLLLDRRVKTDIKNKAGQMPLDIATAADNLDGVEGLLALGVRASKVQMTRISALRAEHGAKAPTDNQREWLRIVVSNDMRAAAKRVKRADFDPLLRLSDGYSLLDGALGREQATLALLLIDNAKTDECLRDQTPDIFLARTANLPVLRRFLARDDFNPNGDKERNPLLFTAINDGNIEGARALLAHRNIQPNAHGDGSGPLWELNTPSPNAEKIAHLLLADPRIDPNLRDVRGQTALFLLVAGQPAVLRAMLADPRVDPNIADDNGLTPLYVAAQMNLPNAKILLDSGRVKVDAKSREKLDLLKDAWGFRASPIFDETR